MQCYMTCVFVFQGHSGLCAVVYERFVLVSCSSGEASQSEPGHAAALTGSNRAAASQTQVRFSNVTNRFTE